MFGLVYHNGMQLNTMSPRYWIRLEPDLGRDPGYWDRNGDLMGRFNPLQPANPSRTSAHWGWYFPLFGDNDELCLGGSGDVEQHPVDDSGELVPDTTSVERHCIRTGSFVVRLERPLGTVVASREIDFISGETVGGKIVEDLSFGSSFTDNVVHFDPAGFSGTFTPAIEPVASGTTVDTFRFDASGTMAAGSRIPLDGVESQCGGSGTCRTLRSRAAS